MNTGRILTPIEIAVARRIGCDLQAVAQQKQHPIFGASLHSISGPFSAAAHFPLRVHAPLSDGSPHPGDSIPGWPFRPVAEAPALGTDHDDDDEDDIDDQAADPLGLKRKKVGVVFPNGRRI